MSCLVFQTAIYLSLKTLFVRVIVKLLFLGWNKYKKDDEEGSESCICATIMKMANKKGIDYQGRIFWTITFNNLNLRVGRHFKKSPR